MSAAKGRPIRSGILSGEKKKKQEESKAIEELQKENASLLKELSEIKSLHNQLLHENPRENSSLKRVNILKTQVFQLERQVIALAETADGYAQRNVEIQDVCQKMVEQLKADKCSTDDSLKFVLQLQSRLSKPNRGNAEKHALPLLFMGDFVKPLPSSKGSHDSAKASLSWKESGAAPTLLDVCSGRMDHINMKKVGYLETKLSKLYGELVGLQSSLSSLPDSVPTLFHLVLKHQLSHVTSTCDLVGECCHELMCLSLLVPTAPWPKTHLSSVPAELSAAELIRKMPAAVRSRKEIRDVLEGVCKYFAHVSHLRSTQNNALEDELAFHKSVYQFHTGYMHSLFNAMREGYKKFQTSVQNCLCNPLADIMGNYDRLGLTPDSEALKELLLSLQKHSSQLKSTVEDLSHTNNSGAEELTCFEENFVRDLAHLEREHCMDDK